MERKIKSDRNERERERERERKKRVGRSVGPTGRVNDGGRRVNFGWRLIDGQRPRCLPKKPSRREAHSASPAKQTNHRRRRGVGASRQHNSPLSGSGRTLHSIHLGHHRPPIDTQPKVSISHSSLPSPEPPPPTTRLVKMAASLARCWPGVQFLATSIEASDCGDSSPLAD